ncbi:MAG: DUF1049 domain-containing protein [Chloroflexi bacterium]|nr:DUF1049 domain-containing protein [Chloroflexota bacterium]
MLLWLLVVAALIFVVASFGFQNAQHVTLDYFGGRLVAVPLWLVVAVPAAAGVLIGSLMALPGRVRAVFARRRVAKQSDACDRTSDALQLRVVGLERDLALARLAAPAAYRGRAAAARRARCIRRRQRARAARGGVGPPKSAAA